MRSRCSCQSSACGAVRRERHSGLARPGPHQSVCVCFHSSHSFLVLSVNRFSGGKPCATANFSAPSPTSITWPVCKRTAFASSETFLMLRTPPTAPAVRVGPCMQHASNSTTPSSFGRPPRPTLWSFGSFSGPSTTLSAASRVSPPPERNAYASSRYLNPIPGANNHGRLSFDGRGLAGRGLCVGVECLWGGEGSRARQRRLHKVATRAGHVCKPPCFQERSLPKRGYTTVLQSGAFGRVRDN